MRRTSIFAAAKNLEIDQIHFGRFELNCGGPRRIRDSLGRKKTMLPSQGFGTRAMIASWCHPNSRRKDPLWPPLVRGGCRGRFRPRSAAVLRPGRPGRSQRCVPLCGPMIGVLLRHPRGMNDCRRFSPACQAMGRVEGFTMQRQSRSPRARPSTSISAVAMLLAKGMLFWSHSREM